MNTLQPPPSHFPPCSHALAPSLRPISEPRHPHRPHRESVRTHQFFPSSELLDPSNRPHHPKRIHLGRVDTVQPPLSSFPVRSRAHASSLSRLTSQFARTTPSPLTLVPWIRALKDSTPVQQQKPFAAHLCTRPPKTEGEKGLPIRALMAYASNVLNRRVLHCRGLTLDKLRQVTTAAAREYPWSTK